MGIGSKIKDAKRIFSQDGSYEAFNSRISNLEGNERKITYYEIVTGTSGTLTVPTEGTINADEFGLSGNAILSKIDANGKPTLQSPVTSGGEIVTANLDTLTGNWLASGVYTDEAVALIYSIKINDLYYQNLNYDNIIEEVNIPDDLTNLVPYTGATNDVDLGEKELTTGKLWLYDAVGGPTEKGSLHYADEALHFENSDGETLLYIEPGFMQIHKDGTTQSNFFVTNLTANRDHYLPDASGTIALQEYVSANYVPTSRSITINGVTKDLSANQDWTIGSTTGVRTPYSFTATAGQTTFTTVGYTVGQIDVYYNGARLLPSEYTATNGSTIVFGTGLIAGDIIEVVIWNVSDTTSVYSFEYFSKNLKAYPYVPNYTGTQLTSQVYTLPTGTITKTFNYTGTQLTSIVLSGTIPSSIATTKTFTYTGTQLTSVTYS